MRYLPFLAAMMGHVFCLSAVGDELSYTRDIQPIFAEKCFGCHGPDDSEGGLQLHEQKLAFLEVDSGGFALVAGKPDESTLFERITSSNEAERMPPDGEPLSEEEVRKLKKWIESGAKYDQHWAFIPVKLPQLPAIKNREWIRNEIDHFVLAKLERNGIHPSPEASKAILAKRLYYDLIGLPPGPEEVERFVNAVDPGAYEELVDHLLASRHFGERWGRHWLDKARYADSDGYEKDRPRPNAWRYRDWVIHAINQDMPFDQFSIEQLAGDLLPNASDMQQLATAFHRQTLTNTEGGTDQEEFRVEATFDRTETVGSIWMGLTLTCARCHTHKYDQITQKEYFQLYSFFNNANEATTKVPISDQAVRKYEQEKEIFDQQLSKLEKELKKAVEVLRPEAERWIEKQKKLVEAQPPLKFHDVKSYDAKASSKAKINLQEDGSFLVTGPVNDKDEYTLFFEPPALSITGIRLETLTDSGLPANGPGRAPNGNFVLSQLRAYRSPNADFKKPQRLSFKAADADFSQRDFSPSGALTNRRKTGWAISPQMGKSHTINFYFKERVDLLPEENLQVVLDQSYGGQHLIGKFRIRLITGSDLLAAFPKDIVEVIQADKPTKEQVSAAARFMAQSHSTTEKLVQALEQLKKNKPSRPELNVRVMVPASRKTQILNRGDFLQPGDTVAPGIVEIVGRTHSLKTEQPDRLSFARWLVDPRHPLTARVTVNQVWGHLFGRGIVATPNDFGVRGEHPSHPQLLDWLAWNFPRSMKWSRKKLIKKIVMSATYRQSSVYRKDLDERDPENQLLARQNRFRVPGEIVRDLCLGVSGLLSTKIGGPSVFPPLPPGVADLSYANNFRWNTSQGEDRYRRGMYTFFKRTSPHPNLITFDCPDSNTTKIQRDVSNTPIQALVTLNNEVYLESAQALAKRVLAKEKESSKQVRFALKLCLVRDPIDSEVSRFESLLSRFVDYYQNHPDEARKLVSRHAVDGAEGSLNAAWVATARVILNLDEFMVRE